jgi:hypothetical protein
MAYCALVVLAFGSLYGPPWLNAMAGAAPVGLLWPLTLVGLDISEGIGLLAVAFLAGCGVFAFGLLAFTSWLFTGTPQSGRTTS